MRLFVQRWLTLLLATVLLAVSSCLPSVSIRTRVLSKADMKNTRVIGSVSVKFTLHKRSLESLESLESIVKRAYEELIREAQSEYVGKNVDVVNILINSKVEGNFRSFTAHGNVISLDNAPPDSPERTPVRTYVQAEVDKPKGLEDAIKKVCSSVMTELPKGSKIAVMSITADDSKISALVLDEVEYNLVSAKNFTIVDRSTLDLIRKEHLIQTDGAFDDATLVKLGKLSGANVVIAGSIMKSGNTNRFSLKAMNVQSGQIITMARESY